MVRLPGEIGGRRIVDSVVLETVVAEIAPQHRGHAELMRADERNRDLLKLPRRFRGTEVDGRAHRDRAEVVGLLDGAEEHLIESVRIRQQLVVVDLDDERDLVRPTARDRPEHTERRRNRVASTFYRELDELLPVEVCGVGCERRTRRMLDALIDGQDREIAGSAEPPVRVQRLEAAQHARRPITLGPDPIDEVGTGQV